MKQSCRFAWLGRLQVSGVRQLLVIPHDMTVRHAGLMRERQVLLELDDGRVFRLHIHRGWQPTPANLDTLAMALAESRGLPHARTAMADYLGWKLETALTVQDCNLASIAPDAAAVRALALEHGLADQGMGKASTGEIHARVRGLEEEIHRDWMGLLADFTDRLDPRIKALATLWPDGLPLARYNWLIGSGNSSRDWRVQAAGVFPALIPVLDGERGTLQVTEAALVHVIDQGRPLLQALADTYGVRKAIARHAPTMPSWLLNGERPASLGMLLRGLSGLPPERYPRTDDDWRVYVHLLQELLPSLTGRPAASPLNAAFLPAISRRGWTVTERKLEGVGLTREGASRLRDFVLACQRFLAEEIVQTLSLPSDEARRLSSRLLDGVFVSIGVLELAQLALRWPAFLGRSRLAHQAWCEHMQGKHWPGVITEPFEWEELRVVALTRPEELVEEGRVMGNCVGTYIQDCLDGRAYLFSVRGGDGVPLATGELDFVPRRTSGRQQIFIVQLKGPGNQRPSSQAARAFHAFTRFLETEAPQARIAQVVTDMSRARKWRLQGDAARLARRIEHEIEGDALKQMNHPQLDLAGLVRRALEERDQAAAGDVTAAPNPDGPTMHTLP
jgi:hypothetical protein